MTTINYYNAHAAEFVADTLDVEFNEIADRFLAHLPDRANVLDFGCGSGRDAMYFLRKDYRVTATDGSPELCRLVREKLGIEVRCELFEELAEKETYDGIWACASILHVTKAEMPGIIRRMSDALVPGGHIYASYKYGDFEGERNGRHFADYHEKSFGELVGAFPELEIIEEWISSDVRPNRGEEKWLNIILRKQVTSCG